MSGIGGPRFWHLTGRPARPRRLEQGVAALALLDAELARRDWLVGARCTIADLAVHGYAHRAGDVGVSLGPAVRAWVERIRALPGFVDDLAPYGENARPGAGRSIYG
jgi:glutathione S-transferase